MRLPVATHRQGLRSAEWRKANAVLSFLWATDADAFGLYDYQVAPNVMLA
jgi:hypothetical protein